MSSAVAEAIDKIDISRSMGLAKFSVDIPFGHILMTEDQKGYVKIDTNNTEIRIFKTAVFSDKSTLKTENETVQMRYQCSVVPTEIDEYTIKRYPQFDLNEMAKKVHGMACSLAQTLLENGTGSLNILNTELYDGSETYELRFQFIFD